MKKMLIMIERTLGILLAVLFLTSACAAAKPAEQTANAAAPQSEAPDAEAAVRQETTAPQTDPVTPAPTPEPPASAPPTPKPTPAPVSDAELNNGALDAFFNDSVLIGDSITAGFSNFVVSKRQDGGACLGNLKCIGQSGLFLKHAYQVEIGKRSPGLPYRGSTYGVSDLVQALGVKTCYLLLGVNDLYAYGVSAADYIAFFDEIVRNTREKSPDVRIVILTVPPVMKTYAQDYSHHPQSNLDVNEALCAYCEENGLGTLALAERLRGEDGFLDGAFCSDRKFHLNAEGQEVFLSALREYARTQYECGAWVPEGSMEP